MQCQLRYCFQCRKAVLIGFPHILDRSKYLRDKEEVCGAATWTSLCVTCTPLTWLDPLRKTSKTGSKIHGLLRAIAITDGTSLEMTDPDIILFLYPNDNLGKVGAERAISMPDNKSRYMPPRHDALKPSEILDLRDRESTEQPEEQNGLENDACLVLRFSDGARTRLGVVAGCGENVELRLAKQPGVSRFHLAFTFDEKNRPIVRDLGSLCGTKVIYDEEDGERRSDFNYLLAGPGILSTKPPVLNVTDSVQFKILVPPRDITSQEYIDRVAKFRQGTADPTDLFPSLGLRSVSGTQPPTGTHTPRTISNAILVKKKLGEGSFGIVTYVWNATSGEEYALKEPLEKVIDKGEVDTESWKEEARVMGQISHDHIVAFRGATFSPWPRLTFEYVSGGSLGACVDLTTFENVQILRQLLSALRYLHGQSPPIGHRDIKPDNILVLYRRSSGIYVKFADFGLAKAADHLTTCCGTLQWAAPEMHDKFLDRETAANSRYSAAVDIWSLGLVIASQECGLPFYKDSYRTSAVAWIRAVLRHVTAYEKKRNTLLRFLLDTMLVVDPQERKGAAHCHDAALRLSNCDVQQPFLRRISPSGLGGYTSSDTDESDEDSDLSTPTPSTPDVQPSTGHEGPVSIDSSLIANLGYYGTDRINSMMNGTGAGTFQSSGTQTPTARLHQEQDNSVALLQGSVLDSVPWNPESANLSIIHDTAAAEACCPQVSVGTEERSLSFLIRKYLGGEIQEDRAEEAVEVSRVTAGDPRQPGRKRTRLDDRSPLTSAYKPHSDLTQGDAACDNTVGRDNDLSEVPQVGKRRKNVASGEHPGSG